MNNKNKVNYTNYVINKILVTQPPTPQTHTFLVTSKAPSKTLEQVPAYLLSQQS